MSIDILFVVSSPDSAALVKPLLLAANRSKCKVAVFLTNDGVQIASRQIIGDELAKLETAIVCADSWTNQMGDEECPVTLGSQTDHSSLAGSSTRIISL